MKSKEAIRNKIIHCANMVWGTKNISNLNPFIHLMVEEICNELYLLDNQLNDIDSTILEKLVKKLSPSKFNYVRPAHGIMYIKPDTPIYQLNRKTNFVLKILPNNFKNQNVSSVVFTPVADLTLLDVSITNVFFNQTLWTVDETGNKSVLAKTKNKAAYNTIWIKLEVGEGVKFLKNLFFYIDFPHQNDIHECYEMLPFIEWKANDKPLKIKQGFPLSQGTYPSRVENDILDFYKDHYQTIQNRLVLNEMPKQNIPDELSDIIGPEIVSSVSKGYWFSLSFPSHFSAEDIEKMIIVTNAFPALNRLYNVTKVEKQELTETISLSSGVYEEFLEMDTVIDSNKIIYQHQDIKENTSGTYNVEPIRKTIVDNPKISDYLEKLIGVIQYERTAFSGINNDEIVPILNSISSIQNKEIQKVDLNRLNEYAEIGRFVINPIENTESLDVSYWTTHVDLVNGLPQDTTLMANAIPELNKSSAAFLTPTSGAKSFYDAESLRAINRFYLTSKDRILAKHAITSFCRIELGRHIKDVDVVQAVEISRILKEGLINIIEIKITPKKEHYEYFEQKGVLKDLLLRLRKRSPDNFNYRIKIL